jgi:HPt (histidine-containing phosphotransfer) domain-containing protein
MIEPLKSEYANDPELAELVEMFVEGLPSHVARLTSAMADGDIESLKSLAHQLKGSAGGYGFPAITDSVRELEAAIFAADSITDVEEQLRVLTDLCERAVRSVSNHS